MYMPLSFKHNCQCCSVASTMVLSDILNQASVSLCEYSHRKAAIAHLSIAITRCKFYVGSFCGINC